MKTCLTSLVILGLHLIVTMLHLSISFNITKVLMADDSLEYTCLRNLNTGILMDLAVLLLPQYPTDKCKHVHQGIHKNVHGCITCIIQNSKWLRVH